MTDDVVAGAREVLASRWENPGPPYPDPVPTGVVRLGDWASEHLPELVAALEQTREESHQLRARLAAKQMRLVEPRGSYTGPGSGCPECGRRFWPSPTQQRKPVVPIHDSPGGVCDGSLTETEDFDE